MTFSDFKTNMMSEDSLENSHLWKAVEAMEHEAPLTDNEWKELFQDKEALQACTDILDTSYVLTTDKHKQTNAFDVEKELNKFKKKHQHTRRIQIARWTASIAATFILCLCGYYFIDQMATVSLPPQKPVLVFEADQQPQQVTLDKGNGEKMVLHTHEVNLAAAADLSSVKQSAKLKVDAQTLQPHKLTIPRGETFKLTLCDGTEVWLNANSYFVYPTAFVGKERVVSLKGEAYFKVAKDTERPFIVKTPHIQTRVLGTEFNLRSYSPDDTHVVLVNGKVEVCNTKGNAYTPMEPGEDAHLQPDGNFIMTEVDLDSYIYWKDGFFYFDNNNLKEIMENIGRWYNVNIQFRNPAAMQHKMHFVASREKPLEHTLNLLNRMKKVTATIQGNTVIID